MEPGGWKSLFGCSNNDNEYFEISRKEGRDESCVADSEFATVQRVLIYLIGRQRALMMFSGANSEPVC
jgi:hypothetical protein